MPFLRKKWFCAEKMIERKRKKMQFLQLAGYFWILRMRSAFTQQLALKVTNFLSLSFFFHLLSFAHTRIVALKAQNGHTETVREQQDSHTHTQRATCCCWCVDGCCYTAATTSGRKKESGHKRQANCLLVSVRTSVSRQCGWASDRVH